ncbi:MAG TPA: hypothetical protein DF783_02225 [Acidimicrobiaceae bacterium]|nr:hypothetical protein [Acidimicrobiaceae bacterium]HCV35713.1 hypothetical protein [Acidimicrobiaceae bacterium]
MFHTRKLIPPGTIIGRRYRLGNQVSDTSCAEVWRGYDKVLQRSVAIKLIRSGDVPTGAGRLAITGAVAVYDTLTYEGLAVVVSEWVDAWPLDRILEQGITLRVDHVIDIVDGVAKILSDAHELGVPHGSVKSSNILLTDNGAVHLTDFRGRADGSGSLDATPDIAGLGVVLAELLSRCRRDLIPPHLTQFTSLQLSTDFSGLPSLLEFRLSLKPIGATGTDCHTSRWLIALAALIATIAVASAASRILYGGESTPEGSAVTETRG